MYIYAYTDILNENIKQTCLFHIFKASSLFKWKSFLAKGSLTYDNVLVHAAQSFLSHKYVWNIPEI